MKNYILFLIAALTSACHHNSVHEELQGIILKGDTIIVTGNNNLAEKLQIDTVTYNPFKKRFTISGIVRAIPNNYAEVASPFAGRITKSYVRLGQHVAVDDPIFEISSPSFYEAGKTYYQTKQELLLREKNLHRQNDLLANGVGIQKDVEEAEVAYELARRDFENSIASLSVFRVKPEELILGQPLIVRSPIKGEIVEDNIVLGQYLREDAEPVAIVAELSKVWVVGQLKEKDIKSIHRSDEVEIRLTGLPDLPIRGEVYHISEILDEETRSVQVFIECDNRDRIMKSGMYVSAQFTGDTDFSVQIPSTSVLQSEGNSFVFIQLASDKYLERPVEIAYNDDDMSIIKSGLAPGDIFVCQGGILLLEAR
jgi:cobalt-zinc-cadmium efflux system membrane fusion protein